MNDVVLFWILAAFCCALFELSAPGLFYFLSFAAGALLTAFASIWLCSVVAQALFFVFSSGITFLVLNKWVKSHAVHHHRTNVDALTGKQGIVTRAINGAVSGEVKVDGQVWSAKSLRQEAIAKGAHIRVVGVIGVHLIVQELIIESETHDS